MTAERMPRWMQPEKRSRWSLAALAAAVLVTVVTLWQIVQRDARTQSFGWNGTYSPQKWLDVTGTHAGVASDSPLCSRMGVSVLQSGGSAADAAVQVALCLGSVQPQSSGIGGGGFITVRLANGTAFVIDARETAPRQASKHMFDEDEILSKYTGLASAVPGEVAGLEKLWEMAGSLAWADLIEPVAAMNDQGFALGEAVAEAANKFRTYLKEAEGDRFVKFMDNSDWCWLYGDEEQCKESVEATFADLANAGLSKDGTPPSVPITGSLIRRPKLAETLRQIAENGAQAFYHGAIPHQLAKITQAHGGLLTAEDFGDYEVVVREALTGRYRGHNIVTAPAPASGPPLLMGLKAIEELQDQERAGQLSYETMVHRMIEVMKWMAAARSELGDPEYINNPRVAQITTDEWAHKVVGNVSDEHTLPSWRDYHPSYEMNDPHGTTHFSVIDENGMAVAMTTTVNLYFGNGVCDPVTGVVMNSEMDDFSTPVRKNGFEIAPSIYNFVQPGKRPLSSTVPAILFDDDGRVEMVIGAAGGSRIMTTVFLAICRMYGESMNGHVLNGLEAVSYPRYHHQLLPEIVMLEPGFSLDLIAALEDKNHTVETRAPGSAMNLIYRDKKEVWHAVSDFYRKRGLGAAY